ILAAYETRWPYIMIDEYQDTNHAQYTWARLLAKNNKNIFVVGDDWQGIYSWRGATIRNILEFEKDYPGAKVILLEQNYRSNDAIVELGNNIIAGNTGQMKKKLWAAKPASSLPEVWQVADEVREAEFVLEKIAELENIKGISKKEKGKSVFNDDITYDYAAEGQSGGILDKIMKGFGRQQRNPDKPFEFSRCNLPLDIGQQPIKWNKYAVLYRTNAQSRAIEEVLLRFGVPYRLIGGIRFYERKEIKDTLAYLRFLLNPNDIVSLDRIINEPARGIGERTLAKIYSQAQKNKTTVLDMMSTPEKIDGLSPARAADVKSFSQAFLVTAQRLEDLSISEAIDLILKRAGYIDYLKDEGDVGADKLENISEIKTVARKFIRLKGRQAILAFLQEIALVSDMDTYDPSKSEALTLMTLHSAKGLEFDTVFLVGIEEGLLPHANSIFEPAQIEEERRLCYVGITRARDNLYLLYTRTRRLYGKTIMVTPSRFLAELGENNAVYYSEDG
ncbi:MAG: 3'-5' exonuclease, partial [Candidatus Komeilibacteria bacterium]|nr:3'-5' exonuclease [Candidatus Komeilibacteria bacterium]